ncbi:LysR family transcriptional regulator [Vibrio astriarenae]|uniref:LysR family transcriptional regulator n=1 Tax=Vibrio astriarenae TaxID=1481923 RepID=A0A7Z2YCM7_9VIBR|nr:LysR family transcriptional regulator [Vibrio astriarenae]QIA62432.1 LysR family transcriptional regulator [Vibrio astriarenae]
MHKRLEKLMLFNAVAKALSFTKAADDLDISKGHLSLQIKQLEKELGFPLLIRSTRSVRLTPEGERIYAGMQSIESTLVEMERNAEYENDTLAGVIRITAPMQFVEGILIDLCRQFRQSYPQVSFEIDSSYTSHDLIKDNFDLAFRATQRPPEHLVARKLFSYSHCVVGSHRYFSDHGYPKAPNDLKAHQCLMGRGYEHWEFHQEKVECGGWMTISDNHQLKILALAGEGLIRVPEYFVYQEVKAGKLERLFDDKIATGGEFHLVYPQIVQRSERITRFIEFAVERLSQLELSR